MPKSYLAGWMLAALLLVPLTANGTPPDDVVGWEGIPWGAGHDAIADAIGRYPSEAQTQDGDFLGWPGLCMVHLMERDYRSLGETYTVRFCEGRHQLLAVWMDRPLPAPVDDQWPSFEQTRAELTRLYGAPATSTETGAQWVFPSTTIDLSITETGRGEEYSVSLIFTPSNFESIEDTRIERTGDLVGWNGIAWLADHDALGTALGSRLTEHDPEERPPWMKTGSLPCVAHQTAPEVRFLGLTYTARLCESQHRLVAVSLYPIDDTHLRHTFAQSNNALAIAYGPSDDRTDADYMQSRIWRFPTTTITLQLLNDTNGDATTFRLLFEPTNPRHVRDQLERLP